MNLHIAGCFSVLQIVVLSVYGADPPAWSYDNNAVNGPPNWYTLPGYEACSGNSQSPINIVTTSTTSMRDDLRFFNYNSYRATSLTLENSGRTVEISFVFPSNTLTNVPYITGGLLSGEYKLVNVHFHWGRISSRGSEHTIDGYRYPMEVHMVHIKSTYESLEVARGHADGVSVIASMYSITNSNNTYMRDLLASIRLVTFAEQTLRIDPINLYNLLPANYDYFYSYRGSLTTPPCSQSVIWNVFRRPAEISETQMQVFRSLQSETRANDPSRNMPLVDNYRALQLLNGRIVYSRQQY